MTSDNLKYKYYKFASSVIKISSYLELSRSARYMLPQVKSLNVGHLIGHLNMVYYNQSNWTEYPDKYLRKINAYDI